MEYMLWSCKELLEVFEDLAIETVKSYVDFNEINELDTEECVDNEIHEQILDLTIELLDEIGICPEF